MESAKPIAMIADYLKANFPGHSITIEPTETGCLSSIYPTDKPTLGVNDFNEVLAKVSSTILTPYPGLCVKITRTPDGAILSAVSKADIYWTINGGVVHKPAPGGIDAEFAAIERALGALGILSFVTVPSAGSPKPTVKPDNLYGGTAQTHMGQNQATAGAKAFGTLAGLGMPVNACAYGAAAHVARKSEPMRVVGGAHFAANEVIPELNAQIERANRNRDRLSNAMVTLKARLQPVLINQPENIPKACEYANPSEPRSRIGQDLEALASALESDAQIVEALADCLAFK